MSSEPEPGPALPGAPDGAPADEAAARARARRRRRAARPPRDILATSSINNRFWLTVLPIAAFLLVDRLADTRWAIGAGLAAAILVFLRTRRSGVVGYLAVGGIVIVGGSATVGIIVDSDKAFFASDAIGDVLWTGAFLGSVVLGRPLMGVLMREIFPGIREWIPERHRVFVALSLAWAAQNVVTAVIRVLLLDALSTNSYLLWSRVATWPLTIGLFALSYYLIGRAIRQEAQRRAAADLGADIAADDDEDGTLPA